MLAAMAGRSRAMVAALRSSRLSNGARELFRYRVEVRGESALSTLILLSASRAARLVAGMDMEMSASPVCTWVARVAPSVM
ncbi:hypothetical protein D3C74_334600 [compost metagenome]